MSTGSDTWSTRRWTACVMRNAALHVPLRCRPFHGAAHRRPGSASEDSTFTTDSIGTVSSTHLDQFPMGHQPSREVEVTLALDKRSWEIDLCDSGHQQA
eukprot:scaffold422_cov399-Prasinococcus_capsulatus_cf.AAC.5